MKQLALPDGTAIPAIGFGTWQLANGRETEQAVLCALETGYRLIDTAKIYQNEDSVGSAIKNSRLAREEIFVTTKLWNDDQGYESALKACQGSLNRLGLEYLDLYLIHWPASEKRHAAWDALLELQTQGKARNIGVSNYSIEHIRELADRTGSKPAVNQIEFHIFNYADQKDLVEYCQSEDIVVEAYSPLARGQALENYTIDQIAGEHGKSAAQVMLRWCMQHATVPIPKSANRERIQLNFNVFDFELSQEDMDTLDSISG